MKKLSVKIILTIIAVFFLSTFIPRLMFRDVIDDIQKGFIERDVILFGMLFSSTLALLMFGGAINHIIIKRIRHINEATRRVAEGDFDVSIPIMGKDEISELSKDFNTMVKALQTNHYLSSTFASQFSHEFKTPVTAINGYAQMIAKDSDASQEIKDSAMIIAQESARLSRLSESILLLSRLESDDIMRVDERYNATEQVRNIIRVMQHLWESKSLTFEIEMDDIMLIANKDLTYQVFHNLIENAIHYGKEHSVVVLSMTKDHDQMRFMITNEGPGIPLEDRTRIFDVFQMSVARDQKSSGIGLSIVRIAISKLKGSVAIKGPDDGPTTFEVTIPIDH
jgi:signal transduction histidine kinase